MTTSTLQATKVDGGSIAAACIKPEADLSKADLRDALDLCGYCWHVETKCTRNANGNRIITARFACSKGRSIRVNWDVSLEMRENHLAAAIEYLNRLEGGHKVFKLAGISTTELGYVFTIN
jgi:hypothetical protein